MVNKKFVINSVCSLALAGAFGITGYRIGIDVSPNAKTEAVAKGVSSRDNKRPTHKVSKKSAKTGTPKATGNNKAENSLASKPVELDGNVNGKTLEALPVGTKVTKLNTQPSTSLSHNKNVISSSDTSSTPTSSNKAHTATLSNGKVNTPQAPQNSSQVPSKSSQEQSQDNKQGSFDNVDSKPTISNSDNQAPIHYIPSDNKDDNKAPQYTGSYQDNNSDNNEAPSGNLDDTDSKPVQAPDHSSIATNAMKLLGMPYRFGGTSPETGFDNAGFVQYVLNQSGYSAPHMASSMAQMGTQIPTSEAKPGDLVFFNHGATVAIIYKDSLFIGAMTVGDSVRVLNSAYIMMPSFAVRLN